MTLALTALCLASGLIAVLGAMAIRRYGAALGLNDVPNIRSSHTQSTPRGGGVGLVIAVPLATFVGLLLIGMTSIRTDVALMASAAIGVVGLVDDRRGLPAAVRLLAQVVAAAAVVAGGAVLALPVPALAAAVTVLWIVAVTNIYNFMDGIDGLAATEALIAAGATAWLAYLAGRSDVWIAMTILAAAAAGFLIMNWPPARVFMGDVGSTFLGFTLAAWSVIGSSNIEGASGTVPFAAWSAVLSPFLLDSGITLIRRAVRGERVYEAHRTHFYQSLVASGWKHASTTLLYGALAAAAGAWSILHYHWNVLPGAAYAALVVIPFLIPMAASRSRPPGVAQGIS